VIPKYAAAVKKSEGPECLALAHRGVHVRLYPQQLYRILPSVAIEDQEREGETVGKTWAFVLLVFAAIAHVEHILTLVMWTRMCWCLVCLPENAFVDTPSKEELGLGTSRFLSRSLHDIRSLQSAVIPRTLPGNTAL
jgi:hypothetical protein